MVLTIYNCISIYLFIFQGCYDKIIGMATSNLNIVFGSLIGLGAVQFVAIVFAFCVCKVLDIQHSSNFTQ